MAKNDGENLKDLGEANDAYLKFGENSGASADDLLNRNEELRDLLEPLLDADGAGDAGADSDPDLPAEMLGDFKLISLIGSGGMGSVYKARQQSLDRIVALKVLPPHLGINPRSLTRFRREATAGAKLRDPGIVTVHAVGEDQGLHYIAQEYVEGGRTLGDYILEAAAQADHLPGGYERGVALLIAQVADSLESAHNAGVVHRDIKPRNILLTAEGLPRVADFGLARMVDMMTMSGIGDVTGTPYYMSPEQAQGNPDLVDHRTDVFSLGVTLFEALAFERPMEGGSVRDMKLMDPPDPRLLRPSVPEALANICIKAMQIDPDKRYQTMRAFSQALRSAPLQRTTTKRRRKKSWTSSPQFIGALATVFLVTALLTALALTRKDAPLAQDAWTPAEVIVSLPKSLEQAQPESITLLDFLNEKVAELDAQPLNSPEREARVREELAEYYRVLGRTEEAELQLERAQGLRASDDL